MEIPSCPEDVLFFRDFIIFLMCLHPLDWIETKLVYFRSDNERDDVSNHRCLDCLHNRLFRRRSKKTSKLRVTGLCGGISPLTGEFPAQRASNVEKVSNWWHLRVIESSIIGYTSDYLLILHEANHRYQEHYQFWRGLWPVWFRLGCVQSSIIRT